VAERSVLNNVYEADEVAAAVAGDADADGDDDDDDVDCAGLPLYTITKQLIN